MSTGVVWFRRDLRLFDNPALAAATTRHEVVAPLYVVEPGLRDRAGDHRRRQFDAELRALADALGGELIIRVGDPETIVPEIARSAGATVVHANADVTRWAQRRDGATESALTAAGVDVDWHWGTLATEPGTVLTKAGTLSRVFTPFHTAWRAVGPPDPAVSGRAEIRGGPGDPPPTADGPPPQPPGEDAAAARLDDWLDRVDDYPETRDLPAVDGTSALSCDLRFGTLSPRHVIEVVGDSTPGRAAFVRQLAWRDWYAHLTMQHPDIDRRALRPEYDRIRWATGGDADEAFAAWCAGRTGYPLVDAGMRELAETGRMHNRVRMVTASFLVKDLLVDWRRGERWFRHHLIDGDVAQNAGNWQWVAGTGPDAAPYFRVFNPVTQSRKFDPDGAYVRRWVPELAGLAPRAVHAPWELAPLELAEAGVVLDDTYPSPMVDHATARDEALSTYRAGLDAD